ncbi:MAG TPA: DNA-processing protein DprA [Acidobacteriota bacterium]|nr:DNA-processing protein DprA [Acidobacteriota bacterium]
MTSHPPDTSSLGRVPADAQHWLALSRLPGIGRVAFLKIVQAYGSPKAAWDHSDSDWKNEGVVRTGFDSSGTRDSALAWAEEQIAALTRSEWSLVPIGDPRYPQPLTVLTHPPPFLFLRGTVPDAPALAVVGARQATEYGARMTREIVAVLAAAGLTIVSGFARGIDTIAHTAALEAGAPTVAVWGCGPDILYPTENRALVDRIAAQGLLVTEFPFGTAPEPHNFPIRNRLIAGLADGVLVMQARKKSGALLTARHAVEQGKNVYAIPGELGHPQYVGSHELLKEGARIITSADDILADYDLAPAPRPSGPPPRLPALTDIEHKVFTGLGGSPCHIDRLAVSLGVSAGECARVLVLLELKGLVRRSAGNMISRAI